MAHVQAERVKDTSTTTGTGSFTVSGSPPSTYQTLDDVLATSDTFYYAIECDDTNQWEVGLGTYSGSHVFARTTVLDGTSGPGSAVSFGAGSKNVMNVLPALTGKFFVSPTGVGIGTSSPSYALDISGTTNYFEALRIQSVQNADGGPIFSLMLDSASPAVDDALGIILFQGRDSAAAVQTFATIAGFVVDPTAATIDGSMQFRTRVASVDTTTMTIRDGRVGIGTTTPDCLLELEYTGHVTLLTLKTTEDGANGALLRFQMDSASPAVGDAIGFFDYYGRDSAANLQQYGFIYHKLLNVTSGTESSYYGFACNVNGAMAHPVVLGYEGRVGIGTTTPSTILYMYSTVAYDGPVIEVIHDANVGASFRLYHNSASPAASDAIGTIEFLGRDSGANATTYVALQGLILDPTDGNEDSCFNFFTYLAGVQTQIMTVGHTGHVGINQTAPLNAHLQVTAGDDGLAVLFNGVTKGIRFVPSSTYCTIEGVDHTGITAYNPLRIGGSTVNITLSGVLARTWGADGYGTILASASLPAAATATITSIPTGYSTITLVVTGWSQATNTCRLRVRVDSDNGASYDATAGNYVGNIITGTTWTNFTTNALASCVDGATITIAQTGSAVVVFHNYQTPGPKRFEARAINVAAEIQCFGTWIGDLTNGIDAIEISTSAAGNFDAGTYALYGS